MSVRPLIIMCWLACIADWERLLIARKRLSHSPAWTARITNSRRCGAACRNRTARQQPEASVSRGSGLTQSRREFIKLLGGAGTALPLVSKLSLAAHTDASIPVVFTDITASAGLSRAVNTFGSANDKQFLLEEMGCGVALFDYDNDGWPDIFLVNGTSFDPAIRDLNPTSYLFHNNRNGTFTDVTAKAGLTRNGWGQGCCVGDYDNDGFDDLFVSYFGRNLLYHNNGNGTFTDVSGRAGVAGSGDRWGAGCCFLDYDRDGHLDLFVANYINFDPDHAP